MVDTEFRSDPPISLFAAVDNGTIARSSRFEVVFEPAEVSTPITVNEMLLMLTDCPSGSCCPNNSVATDDPSTMDVAVDAWSESVRKLPELTERDRTDSQDGVVPTTEAVQFVEPLTSASWLDFSGATPPMSGALLLSANAFASEIVSVEPDPNPPRTPAVLVVLPGVTISRLLPSDAIRAPTACWLPSPRPTVRMTAAIPIRIPSTVRVDRRACARTARNPVRKVSSHVMPAPRATRLVSLIHRHRSSASGSKRLLHRHCPRSAGRP